MSLIGKKVKFTTKEYNDLHRSESDIEREGIIIEKYLGIEYYNGRTPTGNGFYGSETKPVSVTKYLVKTDGNLYQISIDVIVELQD